MDKILCIDEARRVLEEENIMETMSKIKLKVKTLKEEIKYLEQQPGSNTLLSFKKEQLKDLKMAYREEKVKFAKIKEYLIKELTSNKTLISKYDTMIEMYREYGKYDIDVSKLETTITNLESELSELKTKMLKSVAAAKDFDESFYMIYDNIDIIDSRDKNNKRKILVDEDIEELCVNGVLREEAEYDKKNYDEKSLEVFDYNAIKVLSLLGKTKPSVRIKQYDTVIEFIKRKFNLNNSYEILNIIENYLTLDGYEIKRNMSKKSIENEVEAEKAKPVAVSENSIEAKDIDTDNLTETDLEDIEYEKAYEELEILKRVQESVMELIEKLKVKYKDVINFIKDENYAENGEIKDISEKSPIVLKRIREFYRDIQKIKEFIEKIKAKYQEKCQELEDEKYIIDSCKETNKFKALEKLCLNLNIKIKIDTEPRIDINKFVKTVEGEKLSKETTKIIEEQPKKDRLGNNIVSINHIKKTQVQNPPKVTPSEEPEIAI